MWLEVDISRVLFEQTVQIANNHTMFEVILC